MALPLPSPKTLGQIILENMGNIDNNIFNSQRIKQGEAAEERRNQLFPLQLEKAQMENELFKPTRQADIQSKMAQAARQNQLIQQPFAGRQIPGAGGEALGIEMLKQEYGENSPVYQNAKNAYELQQRKGNQLIDYQGALAESLPKRVATPLGKMTMEQADIEKGFMPGTSNPISPEEQQKLKDQYRLKVIKDISDPKTRERANFATNMEKTIKTLNPDDLTVYSGLSGRAKLAKDATLSAAGKTVPEYVKYKKALTSSKLLAKQVRQFYGDSIQPEVQKALGELTNPTTWFENAEVAKDRYEQFINILNTEADTFFDALSKSSAYENKRNNAEEGRSSEKRKYSEEDIAHTAKKYGMTIEQVKKRIGQ